MENHMHGNIHRILTHPIREWTCFVAENGGSSRRAFRELAVDWKIYNIKDYLFTHDTIVASVAVEEDGFTIKPSTEELVNANGNAWTPEVLLNCYKTFIGGENYYEHIQVPSLSKGKILDAVIRETHHNGNKIYVVDILVATSRIHKGLVARIENGELTTMSMGATAKCVQCSVCGKIINTVKREPNCYHLEHLLGKKTIYQGKEKFCAELCGAIDPQTREYIPDSCIFIEASWVEQPAFEGAVINYLIETPEITTLRQEKQALESVFNVPYSALRAAGRGGQVTLQLARELEYQAQTQALTWQLLNPRKP